MDAFTVQEMSANTIEKVVVHPLVLRNIGNVHNRLAGASGKRIVGVLLGSSSGGIVGVANSYTVPFEENHTDPSRWLDCKHLESMFRMFKGINANEYIVGWFSTFPELQDKDFSRHALFTSYAPNPVFITIDVRSQDHAIPTKAFHVVNDALVHVSIEIGVPNLGTSRTSTLVTEMTPGGPNNVVDMIERLYTNSKNSVRIQVEGYDILLPRVDVALSLERLFEPCGVVHDVEVFSHSSTVVLRGEGAAEKALAFDGRDMGGCRVSVTILPPELPEMSTGMSAREFAVLHAANQYEYKP